MKIDRQGLGRSHPGRSPRADRGSGGVRAEPEVLYFLSLGSSIAMGLLFDREEPTDKSGLPTYVGSVVSCHCSYVRRLVEIYGDGTWGWNPGIGSRED